MAVQKNVLEYLEESARRHPRKLVFTDERTQVTYEEFLQEARRVGTLLAKEGECVNSPIAVFVDRRVSSLEAFFGILFSGNFYVPIDNTMPRQRIMRLLERLSPALVLYDPEDERLALEFSDRYPLLCTEKKALYEPEEELLARRRSQVLDIDPVYAIFTSGSTGTPKGIVISHRAVIDFIDWMAGTCGFTEQDVMGNQAPFYFDCSVKDIYLTLKCGATSHILPKKLFSFPILLMQYLRDKQVTALVWATSGFNLVANSGVLAEAPPLNVRKVAVGGEAMMAKNLNIWRRALPEAEFFNLYGPTEVTVDCTYYKVDREFRDTEAVPIGRPCANKEVLLLDERLRPVVEGEPGEMCVRGIGVARGYYNDPEKTAEAFVQNPNNPYYPDIIYRTGDIALRDSEGLLVFQSRKDGQIKHMGYRIELGEIERAVSGFSKIRESFCFYDEGKGQIVCVYDGEVQPGEIIRYLRDFLPKYMYPNVLKIRPLLHNANGKIDRARMREEYFHENPKS